MQVAVLLFWLACEPVLSPESESDILGGRPGISVADKSGRIRFGTPHFGANPRSVDVSGTQCFAFFSRLIPQKFMPYVDTR